MSEDAIQTRRSETKVHARRGPAKNILGKAEILAIDDSVTETVYVPEWQGNVIIRTITARERDAFEASVIDRRGKAPRVATHDLRARFVVICAADEQGKRLFADADIPQLSAKNAKAIDRLFDAAQRINGLTDEDVKELEGNSESGQTDV